MLDIDAAIKHCEEVARNCEDQASQCDVEDRYERHVMYENAECAADHRQLAEWLTELKEAKRLLKMAVEDLSTMPCNNDTHSPDSCYICEKHGNCSYTDSFKWCKADIALKLIGETNEP